MNSAIETTFERMVRAHDMGYAMCDSSRTYQAGRASMQRIEAEAMKLPKNVAAGIWNRVVEEKFEPDAREFFYWDIK